MSRGLCYLYEKFKQPLPSSLGKEWLSRINLLPSCHWRQSLLEDRKAWDGGEDVNEFVIFRKIKNKY